MLTASCTIPAVSTEATIAATGHGSRVEIGMPAGDREADQHHDQDQRRHRRTWALDVVLEREQRRTKPRRAEGAPGALRGCALKTRAKGAPWQTNSSAATAWSGTSAARTVKGRVRRRLIKRAEVGGQVVRRVARRTRDTSSAPTRPARRPPADLNAASRRLVARPSRSRAASRRPASRDRPGRSTPPRDTTRTPPLPARCHATRTSRRRARPTARRCPRVPEARGRAPAPGRAES